jgi:hypothetical protein
MKDKDTLTVEYIFSYQRFMFAGQLAMQNTCSLYKSQYHPGT